jgi:hypothetical protein
MLAMRTQFDFASRLMNLHNNVAQKPTSRAIFGSGSELTTNLQQQKPYRIGLWPCIIDESVVADKKAAMGLWSSFAHLLTQYGDIQVYRIFGDFSHIESHYADISLEDMSKRLPIQFSVDDWIFESLNENVAIWGNLSFVNNIFELKIFIESDIESSHSDTQAQELDGEDDTRVIEIHASNLSQLIINVSSNLMKILETAHIPTSTIQQNIYVADFNKVVSQEGITDDFLKALFQWDVNILVSLWANDFDDDRLDEHFNSLNQTCATPLEYWLLGSVLYESMLPGLSVIGDLLLELIATGGQRLPSEFVYFYIRALHKIGRSSEALEVLVELPENSPKDYHSDVLYWLNLGDLHIRSGDLVLALDVLQTGIEFDATSHSLFRLYAYTFELADRYSVPYTTFILIDPDDIFEDRLLWEAVYAYDEILKNDPSQLDDVVKKLGLLVQLDYPSFWQSFEELLTRDENNEHVLHVIEMLEQSDITDIKTGTSIIEDYKAKSTDASQQQWYNVYLIHLYILDDQKDLAQNLLNELEHADEGSEIRRSVDLQYLSLLTQIDDFAYELGEIRVVLDAGNAVSQKQMTILRRATAIAPTFISVHLLYARALRVDGMESESLEYLIDLHERLPRNVDVIAHIVGILREYTDDELTEQYIQRGLSLMPSHLQLLIQATYFYIDLPNHEYARELLAQIESLAPNNRELGNLKHYVAQQMRS